MKDNKLINAFGQIDDRFILESAPKMNSFETSKKDIKANKKTSLFRRPAAVAAAIVLCVCLSGVTLASTGKLPGFFKDVFGLNGSVIGTKYEQATDEIEIITTVSDNKLLVEITMVCPDKTPYSEFETFGIHHYEIMDVNNDIISEGTSETSKITEDRAIVNIPLDDISNGNYKLVISKMSGNKKAEQPLILSGNWECAFTK